PDCVEAIEPCLSKDIIPEASTASRPSDPTLGRGPLSPATRSFIKFAQRISRLKRGKASAESLSIQTKKPRRDSWHRPWSDEVHSDDSLSDSMSSLYLGSLTSSRRASKSYIQSRELRLREQYAPLEAVAELPRLEAALGERAH